MLHDEYHNCYSNQVEQKGFLELAKRWAPLQKAHAPHLKHLHEEQSIDHPLRETLWDYPKVPNVHGHHVNNSRFIKLRHPPPVTGGQDVAVLIGL